MGNAFLYNKNKQQLENKSNVDLCRNAAKSDKKQMATIANSEKDFKYFSTVQCYMMLGAKR